LSSSASPKVINTPRENYFVILESFMIWHFAKHTPKVVNFSLLSLPCNSFFTNPLVDADLSTGEAFLGKDTRDWPSYRSSSKEQISSVSSTIHWPEIKYKLHFHMLKFQLKQIEIKLFHISCLYLCYTRNFVSALAIFLMVVLRLLQQGKENYVNCQVVYLIYMH